MAVECFCGCGQKVKFSRRAFNGTGRLVRARLNAFDEREETWQATGAWTDNLEEFLGAGEHIDLELQSIAHGGRAELTYSQKAITEWLRTADQILVETDEALGG